MARTMKKLDSKLQKQQQGWPKISNHREHTILLSRERVNKGTKRMNRLPVSPVVISFILRGLLRDNITRIKFDSLVKFKTNQKKFC